MEEAEVVTVEQSLGRLRSIRHADSVRRIPAGEAASGGTGGAGAAASSEATEGGGAADSGDSQTSSSNAVDGHFSSRDRETTLKILVAVRVVVRDVHAHPPNVIVARSTEESVRSSTTSKISTRDPENLTEEQKEMDSSSISSTLGNPNRLPSRGEKQFNPRINCYTGHTWQATYASVDLSENSCS